jgi:predicted glycosyltransferase
LLPYICYLIFVNLIYLYKKFNFKGLCPFRTPLEALQAQQAEALALPQAQQTQAQQTQAQQAEALALPQAQQAEALQAQQMALPQAEQAEALQAQQMALPQARAPGGSKGVKLLSLTLSFC